MNILEALKKYIRANGGSSRANNISEAVKDLDSIPQGSGGGGMVVNFSVDAASEDQAIVSADKTPSEVIAAALTGPVVGTLFSPALGVMEIIPIGSVVFSDMNEPAFFLMSIADEDLHYLISTEDGNWVVNIQ